MTQQQATHPAVTGEERLRSSILEDKDLQGHWVIYETLSYDVDGAPDRLILHAVTERNTKKAYPAFAAIRTAIPGRAIGIEFIPAPRVGELCVRSVRF